MLVGIGNDVKMLCLIGIGTTSHIDELIEAIMQKPITEMQELYNNRDIEK